MQYFRYIFFFILFSVTAFSQTLSDKAQISLLTCGPGNEMYSIYGHTAIRVHDPVTFTDIVYNYGTFDFDTPNFYLKFVKGDMMYMLSSDSYYDFINTYRYYDRDVYEQVLNLTQVQKQQFATQLASDIQSDKRYYQYKFIDRNCTTMAAEKIEAAMGSGLNTDIKDKGLTYREILYTYLQDNHFYENLGINLIFGAKTDKDSDTIFLPLELLESIQKTNINNKPLTNATATVYKSTGAANEKSPVNNFYIYLLIIVSLIAFSGRRPVYVSLLVIFGLLGVFFTTVGFYSFHLEISQNYNALLLNPLYLIVIYFLVTQKSKLAMYTIYICLLCLAVYIILMLNKPHLLMVLPLVILNAILLIRLLRQNTAYLLKHSKI